MVKNTIKQKISRMIIDCIIIFLMIFGYHKLVIEDKLDVAGTKYKNDVKKVFDHVKSKEDSLQVLINRRIDSLDQSMNKRVKKISTIKKDRENEKEIIRNADSLQLDSIIRSAGIEPVVLQ